MHVVVAASSLSSSSRDFFHRSAPQLKMTSKTASDASTEYGRASLWSAAAVIARCATRTGSAPAHPGRAAVRQTASTLSRNDNYAAPRAVCYDRHISLTSNWTWLIQRQVQCSTLPTGHLDRFNTVTNLRDKQQPLPECSLNKIAQLSLGKTHYSLYTVSVTVLTFKIVQGQWFSCHLNANMPLPTNGQ